MEEKKQQIKDYPALNLFLCVFGIIFISIGSFFNHLIIRISGLLISSFGLLFLGLWLYDRIKEKVKARKIIRISNSE